MRHAMRNNFGVDAAEIAPQGAVSWQFGKKSEDEWHNRHFCNAKGSMFSALCSVWLCFTFAPLIL